MDLPDRTPRKTSPDPERRAVLRGLLATGAAAFVGACTPGGEDAGARGAAAGNRRATATTVALPPTAGGDDGVDDTESLRRSLESGAARVVVPAGTYRLSGELRVPWSVRELVLEDGAVLQQHADEAILRRVGEITRDPLQLSVARKGDPALVVHGGVPADAQWIYACSDDWIKEGKSKRGILRSIEAIDGEVVSIDKAVIADLTENPRAHIVRLAPPLRITGGGILEQVDPDALIANLIRLDFVSDPVVEGVELRRCGGAAVRTFGTVGGRVDTHIHDLLDDEDNGHYGYGVSASSTTRDLTVAGTIERCRHAFTTDHGWDPLVPSIAKTGEPEDLLVQPRVSQTTATGIDSHEPGDGIVIVPHVQGAGTRRWGGINVRARNVTICGGEIDSPNEWGVLVQSSTEGTTSIQGTRIRGVADGNAVLAKSDTILVDPDIRGFGRRFGINVEPGSAVTVRGGRIDGQGQDGSRGIGLQGSGSSLRDVELVDCEIGVLVTEPDATNELRDLEFRGCRDDVVRAD